MGSCETVKEIEEFLREETGWGRRGLNSSGQTQGADTTFLNLTLQIHLLCSHSFWENGGNPREILIFSQLLGGILMHLEEIK